jgi:hypothetical protein
MRSTLFLISGAAVAALGARTVSTCVQTAHLRSSLAPPEAARPHPANAAPLYLRAFESSSLDIAAQAASLPYCRFDLPRPLALDTPLPHLAGLLELSDRSPDPDLAALLPRALEHEPILASQSVRWALIERACLRISDSSLDLFPDRWIELAARLEEGNLREMFAAAVERELAMAWAARPDLDRASLMIRAVRLANLPYRRAADDETRLERALADEPDAPALRRSHARMTAAAARLALTRHYCLRRAGLDPRLPEDPFSGAPFLQSPSRVYSVGPNLRDELGGGDDIALSR